MEDWVRVRPAAVEDIDDEMVRRGAEAICLPSAWHTGKDDDPLRARALADAHRVLKAVFS